MPQEAFDLKVVTPTKTLFEGQASSARFEGGKGQTEILPGHTNLMATGERGDLQITPIGEETQVLTGIIVQLADTTDGALQVLADNLRRNR